MQSKSNRKKKKNISKTSTVNSRSALIQHLLVNLTPTYPHNLIMYKLKIRKSQYLTDPVLTGQGQEKSLCPYERPWIPSLSILFFGKKSLILPSAFEESLDPPQSFTMNTMHQC